MQYQHIKLDILVVYIRLSPLYSSDIYNIDFT